jgi:phosphatidylglycerol:prolipoprotein diacylglycerol transferase
MHPELFRIFGFPVRSFGVMIIVGFLAGYWLAARRVERYGMSRSQLADLSVLALIAGVIGARLGWVIQEWPHFSQHLGDIPKAWEGGMTSYGGILFAMLGSWVWCRRAGVPIANALDLMAAPALVMHAFGRIGCLLNGCCYGGPCSLPWAVTVHPDSGSPYLGHPAQLYDSLMAFGLAGLLFLYEKRRHSARRPGEYAALFFILYGASRYVYEMFRIGFSSSSSFDGFPLTDGQLVAIGMVLIGAVWLWLARRKRSET